MDFSKNYYEILGVLPSAEHVVIRAAYRALMMKYHPDTWTGDKAFAEHQTRLLNEAHAVLSVARSRKEYDQGRTTADSYDQGVEVNSEAFEAAEQASIDDWKIAVEYYPEIDEIYAHLKHISTNLAFAFRSTILENKQFGQAEKLARELERNFLQTYFGSNAEILTFARYLIGQNKRLALRELNRTVAVLGTQLEPHNVISRIQEKHLAKDPREKAAELRKLVGNVNHRRQPPDAVALVHFLNGEINYGERRGWFSVNLEVACLGKFASFRNELEMVDWVISDIVPLALSSGKRI